MRATAKLFFSLLLALTLRHCRAAATSPPAPACARAGAYGQVRIPLGALSDPVAPWTRPFPGECLSWDARGSWLSFRERVSLSVCDSFTVDVAARYFVVISTHEVHRDVRDTPRARLFAEYPFAVVRIFEDGRFLQWVDYDGNHFGTRRALRPGRRYTVCVGGRAYSFTMCTINFIACESGKMDECGVPERGEVATHYRHARRYSERQC